MESFTHKYVEKLKNQLDHLDHQVIYDVIKKLDFCEDNSSTIYVVGNGGSAATASHMQNDLGVGLRRRGVSDLNIVSLCDNISVLTALANDVGYENIFYYQLENIIKENDLLISISCSGNSKNIIKAVEYSKNIRATTIGMTGFDGGELKKIVDVSYHIETENGEYGVVEDMHMMLDHMIYTYYIEKNNNVR